jgi:hypothetical protein
MNVPLRLRVGITVDAGLGQGQAAYQEVCQRSAFLAMALRKAPNVASVHLLVIAGVLGPEVALGKAAAGFPVAVLPAAADQFDVVIDMAGWVELPLAQALRARSCKLVSFPTVNAVVLDMEAMNFGKTNHYLQAGLVADAVWMLPDLAYACATYAGAGFAAPVQQIPLLWSPCFADALAALQPRQLPFGYRAGRKRWRAAIFETNDTMTSAGLIPLLVAEGLVRQDSNALEKVLVMNAMALKAEPTFVSLATSLDVVKKHLATFETGHPPVTILAQLADVVISHQWERVRSLADCEALYGGYPLIHNSPLMASVGYYYPNFDCEKGTMVLGHAKAQHDQQLRAYRLAAKNYLATLNPLEASNVAQFNQALLALFAERV